MPPAKYDSPTCRHGSVFFADNQRTFGLFTAFANSFAVIHVPSSLRTANAIATTKKNTVVASTVAIAAPLVSVGYAILVANLARDRIDRAPPSASSSFAVDAR